MKKILSVLLALCMVLTCVPVLASAVETEEMEMSELTEITAEGNYPVIFVTGIGQTHTRLLNEDGTYKTDDEGNFISYNLFYADTDNLLKNKDNLRSVVRLVVQFLASAFLNKNVLQTEDIDTVINALFRYNIVDENGQLPDAVAPVLIEKPVSEYDEYERDGFFRSIPCEDVIDIIGEDNVYCYNYSAFSFLRDDASGLNDFIENVVKPQTGAEKVVLVPMSMGAAVTNAYLQDYAQNNSIRRIVSIVGAWNGSDVFADLIEGKYTADAPEMVYNGLVSELVGMPWGYLVNIALRIMPKAALRSIIDQILDSLMDQFILKTTSLLALIPAERYPAIRETVLADSKWDTVRAECDHYYTGKVNTAQRLKELNEEQGLDVFFICGYGLGFGGYSSDYAFFKFMYSAESTNSDEIIQISSTGVGTTYAPYGTKLNTSCYKTGTTPGADEYISPDGSIDVSTCVFPDRIWCFSGQKHELERNNTALRLALDLAVGKYDSSIDSADVYPRFNDSRDIRSCVNDYMPALAGYIKDNADNTEGVALAQSALDACTAMVNNTFNNREEDDKVIENAYNTLVLLGVYEAPEEGNDFIEDLLNDILKFWNDSVYKIYGPKGFADFTITDFMARNDIHF